MPVSPPSNAEVVYDGLQLKAYRWPQTMFDGSTALFECASRPDAATVIPFLDSNTVLMTKQFQPHRDAPFFDFPSGIVDAGESFEEAARRELREETGYECDELFSWKKTTNKSRILFEEELFLAKGMKQVGEIEPDAGEKIELVTVGWKELVNMCLREELRQPRVMLAVLAMEYDPETKKRLHAWLNGT